MNAYFTWSSAGYMTDVSYVQQLTALSVFHAKKHFKNVFLITDSDSAEIFKNTGFSKIYKTLEKQAQDSEVWSLPKLTAYHQIAQMGKPFIHIDWDVILWRPLPEDLLQSGVFVQNKEPGIFKFYEVEKFLLNCPRRHIFEFSIPGDAYNLGIFGGSDTKFIQDYAEAAIAFVTDKANEHFWKNYAGYENSWAKPILAEQYFFSAFAESRKITPKTLLPPWPSEDDGVRAGYTHLMQLKKDPEIQKRVHKRYAMMEAKE